MVPKFRGKTIKGLLVVGYVSVVTDKRAGVEPGTYISNGIGLPFAYEVDPETVGQSTGLKDKNGVDIFEGDVGWDAHFEEYGEVVFENGSFRYEFGNISEDLFEVTDDIEIVGNIYENPELLEQANEN